MPSPGPAAGVLTQCPRRDEAFRFQAMSPGLYVYHCATPMVSMHIASGMYGLIVVEPPGGLPKLTTSSMSCRATSTCRAIVHCSGYGNLT